MIVATLKMMRNFSGSHWEPMSSSQQHKCNSRNIVDPHYGTTSDIGSRRLNKQLIHKVLKLAIHAIQYHTRYHPHMPTGMLRIYRLLFVSLSANFLQRISPTWVDAGR